MSEDMSENGRHQWIKSWPRAFLRSDMSETSVDLLARHWMNERHAPEILPAQEALLSSILDHLKRYVPSVSFFENTAANDMSDIPRPYKHCVETLQHQKTNICGSPLYSSTSSASSSSSDPTFAHDCTRFACPLSYHSLTFLSFFAQIEKYARHIISSPSIQTRLTAAERDHASRHADLSDRHFSFSVLQSLPEPQRHLDDEVPYYMPSMGACNVPDYRAADEVM